jgi:hypothetical protein
MWTYPQFKDFRRAQNQFAIDWFQKKQYSVQTKYPFILKEYEDWRMNIILPEVADFIQCTKDVYEKKGDPFPLHKYIHHGLSSQAMLFNLIGDPARIKDHTFFQNIFDFPAVIIDANSEFLFELSDRNVFNERQQQPTSFDFAVLNATGKHIFLEAKYVEAEFGQCSTIEGGECDGLNPVMDSQLCYLTHKGRKYWELMNKYQLGTAYEKSLICPLAIYYQFYREFMFALERNGYYVILYDKRNPAFLKSAPAGPRGLIPTLLNSVPPDLQPYIKTMQIQDVVDVLDRAGYGWVSDFKGKYGITRD